LKFVGNAIAAAIEFLMTIVKGAVIMALLVALGYVVVHL
jgi:hypothetical protein